MASLGRLGEYAGGLSRCVFGCRIDSDGVGRRKHLTVTPTLLIRGTGSTVTAFTTMWKTQPGADLVAVRGSILKMFSFKTD